MIQSNFNPLPSKFVLPNLTLWRRIRTGSTYNKWSQAPRAILGFFGKIVKKYLVKLAYVLGVRTRPQGECYVRTPSTYTAPTG